MLSILNLPDELLVYIFKHVKGRHSPNHVYHDSDTGHVKDVRLTCKRFCKVSSHLLHHRVTVEVTQEALTRLENIWSHPDIYRGVEHVAISFRLFAAEFAHNSYQFALHLYSQLSNDLHHYQYSDNGDEEERQKILHDVTEIRAILASWSKCMLENSDVREDNGSFAAGLEKGIAQETSGHLLVLKKAYEQYRHRFDQQQQLLASSTFTNAVVYACTRFPKFGKLELYDHDQYIRSMFGQDRRWRAGIADLETLSSLMIDSMR